MKYLTSLETAEKWGVTKRYINLLCNEGLIDGAYKKGYRWMIPESANKPDTANTKQNGKWEVRKIEPKQIQGEVCREMPELYPGRRPLPIGISDFKTAVLNYYYVDKTLFIKDILDYRPLVSLFTRPRRFGKTLNMDMLRVFFEVSGEDTSKYFKKTKIWSQGEKYRREQGKYPVIFLTFKDIKYENWEDAFINLKAVIQAEYNRHSYILNEARISELNRKFMNKVLDDTFETALWPNALAKLTALLNEHYEKRPIIFIDEYDTPIQQGYLKGYHEKVIQFMRNFLSGGLKDNPNLSMAFLTGILRVARESIFSGLNNLNVNSILEERYSQYFGFTADEINGLLISFGQYHRKKELESWYDGYRFGNTDIYNPWSVLNYLDNNCTAKPFWQSTGSNEIIGEILENATSEIMDNLRILMSGKTLNTYIDTAVIYPEIRKNPYSIYSFLLMAGYLTVRFSETIYDGNQLCEVAIPNREISVVYEKEILSRLNHVLPPSTAISIQRALIECDQNKLQQELTDFLMDTVSFHDTSAEIFYHGLMLGISAVFNNYYEVTSNREVGTGRFDIQLKPYDKRYPGYVLELKAVTKMDCKEEEFAEYLDELLKTAMNQITEMEYCRGLEQYGCLEVIKIALVFYKKKCRVLVERSHP